MISSGAETLEPPPVNYLGTQSTPPMLPPITPHWTRQKFGRDKEKEALQKKKKKITIKLPSIETLVLLFLVTRPTALFLFFPSLITSPTRVSPRFFHFTIYAP